MIQLIQDPIRELDQLDHGSPFPGGQVRNFAESRTPHPPAVRGVRCRDVRMGPAGEHVGLHWLRGRAVFERGGGFQGGRVHGVPRWKGIDTDASRHGEFFFIVPWSPTRLPVNQASRGQ